MCTEDRYSTPMTRASIASDLGRRLLALLLSRCPRRPSAAFVVFLLALVTASVLTGCCFVVVIRAQDSARLSLIIETRNSDVDDDDDDDSRINRTSLLDRRFLDDFGTTKRQNPTQPKTQNNNISDVVKRKMMTDAHQFLGLPLHSSQQTSHRPTNSTYLRPSSSAEEDRHSINNFDRATSFSEWLLLQVNRTALLLETCATFSAPKKSGDVPSRQCGRRLDGIFVDRSRRILYCAIPKVASSSVKLAMALMTGRVNRTAAHYGSSSSLSYPVHSSAWLRSVGVYSLDYLVDSDSRWLKAAWPSLRKFLVVRHPVERLVSAYVDKFTLRNRFSDYFQRRYGRRIVRLYRGGNASAKNNIFGGGGGEDSTRGGGGGHDVSFGEFVRFLLDRRIPCAQRSNPHWMSYYELCHPCFIDYDFVVHFENLAEEMHHLWHSLYRKANVSDVLRRRNAAKTRSRDLVSHYVDQLPDGYLSVLYDTYEMDFRLFMYSL